MARPRVQKLAPLERPPVATGGALPLSPARRFPPGYPGVPVRPSAAPASAQSATPSRPADTILRTSGEDHIHVQICLFTGDEFDLLVDLQSKGSELKLEIERSQKVPTYCQILLAGSDVVDDTDDIARHCELGSGELVISILINAEEALRRLRQSLSGSEAAKLDALDCCLRLRLSLDAETTSNLIRLLQDEASWDVRTTALHVLAKAAPEGDSVAADALARLVRSGTHPLRGLALPALARVAPRGYEAAAAAAHERCRDRKLEIRVAALGCLTEILQEGDERGMATATAGLRDDAVEIRKASYHLLRFLSPGDHALLEAARMLFESGEAL